MAENKNERGDLVERKHWDRRRLPRGEELV